MTRPGLPALWAELQAQWTGNARLRAGLWVVLAIAWVYGLLLAGDAVEAERKRAEAVAEEIDSLRPLARGNPWTARLDDARQQLDALRAMQWPAAEVGLAEAAFQDWVRTTASKAGLRVRELSLSRTVLPATPAAAASAREGAGTLIKLRLSVEMGRNELLAFLAEVGRYEQVVVVERLLMRPAQPVGSAEIDLRIRAGAPAPGGPR